MVDLRAHHNTNDYKIKTAKGAILEFIKKKRILDEILAGELDRSMQSLMDLLEEYKSHSALLTKVYAIDQVFIDVWHRTGVH